VSGKFAAASADVDGVATNKFFLFWILEILPARHPSNGGIGDAVGRSGLTHQARDVSIAGAAVEMVAEVAAELSAGVCDSCGPVARLGVEHDVRSLHARCGKNDNLGVDLDFSLRLAIDISDTLRHSVFVGEDGADECIGDQGEVLRLLGVGNGEPGG